MAPWCQIFLGFSLEIALGIRKNFVFTVLPFGLFQAPWLFSRVMSPIKAHLGRREIWNTGILDDFMFLALSQEDHLNKAQYIVEFFSRHHLLINYQKSNLIHSQKVTYLRVHFHLDSLFLCLPEKIQTIMQLTSKLCSWRVTSRRRLEEIIRFLNFALDFLHLGRWRLRLIILWVNSHTSSKTRNLRVSVSAELKNLVRIWLNEDSFRYV